MVPEAWEMRVNYGIAALVFLFLILAGTTLTSFSVSGADNDTTLTRVNITNTEPDLHGLMLDPVSVDLSPANTTQINCTGYVYDLNGWDDVDYANATLYDYSQGDGPTTDNNYRYRNSSCSCAEVDANNASCSCIFDVWYYANNGTWQCNMTAYDSYGISDTNTSNNITINTVIGIDSQAEIDYGNLSVTETSTDKTANVSNYGNALINVSVRAYGGDTDATNPGNNSLTCDLGNITLPYERYSLSSGTDFTAMTAVTNDSTYMGLQVPVRTNDTAYENDTQLTYWKLRIPLTVGGYCNGTLIFTAEEYNE